MKSREFCFLFCGGKWAAVFPWVGFLLLTIILLFSPGCAANNNNNLSVSSGKTVRVFVDTFEDAPDAPGSGKLFTSAFTSALQTVSSKVNARYVLMTDRASADAIITGRVTIWKKGGWTEQATVGFAAECVAATGEILWNVSEAGRPFRMALEQRTPEYCAEAVALDGIHKIRQRL